MRSKLVYFGAVVCVIAAALWFGWMDAASGQVRYLQHQKQPDAKTLGTCAVCEGKDTSCTHLPVICLETNGQAVPGAAIRQGSEIVGYTTAPDGSEMISAALSVQEKENSRHHVSDAADVQAQVLLRLRGNSSREFDKKSYRFKIVDSAGENRNAALLGMNPGSEWVLNGPYLDRTLLRNYLAYSVAGQVMEYAPDVRYCELYLNGEYQGLYLLTEAIAKGEGRIELTKPEGKSPVTSWLIRLDRAEKATLPLNNFTYYTLQSGVSGFDLLYPGKNTLTQARADYVEAEVSAIERAVYSADRSDPVKGYASYLDTTAFARYFVLNEFFGNVDAGRFSTYLYKDARGKVKPCVWDFNNACDNYVNYIYGDAGFTLTDSPWFDELIQDQAFVDAVIREYRSLRNGVLSDAYLCGMVDETVLWLGDAVDRNYTVWGDVFDLQQYDDANYLAPVGRNYTSYTDAVEQLKTWMQARGAWLDANIETLRQYSHPSRQAAQAIY